MGPQRPRGIGRGRSEKEREVYSSWFMLHQDSPEASHQGWEEGNVRQDRDGRGHEGKDSGESQACVCLKKCGLRYGCGKPYHGLKPALCSCPHLGVGLCIECWRKGK